MAKKVTAQGGQLIKVTPRGIRLGGRYYHSLELVTRIGRKVRVVSDSSEIKLFTPGGKFICQLEAFSIRDRLAGLDGYQSPYIPQ